MADKTSILVQLGLSKSQIKQLPRSIRDEADMIDGTRDIVAKMPAGAAKSIMTSSIAEAIDIFKSTLLEQTEVELTELQKKQIQEHKPEEGREITETPTGEEQPETGEQPGEEKPGGEEEPAGEEGKEGGEEGGKEGGEEFHGGGRAAENGLISGRLSRHRRDGWVCSVPSSRTIRHGCAAPLWRLRAFVRRAAP